MRLHWWVVLALGGTPAFATGCGPKRMPYTPTATEVVTTTFALMPSARVMAEAMIYPGDRKKQDKIKDAPITLTASDGTGLKLVVLDARAIAEGPLAFTELHLTFENPEDRRLEGRFAIALPPHAAVSRLAVNVGGAWQEAEVVERARARQTYEATLHARRDPVLLEKGAGDAFEARIFPIEPHEQKELIVSYSQELTATGVSYELPLRGLPKLDRLHVSFATTGGRLFRNFGKSDVAPESDFEVPVTNATSGLRAADMVIAKITPQLPPLATGGATFDGGVAILFDTSASRGTGFARAAAALRDTIAALPARAAIDVIAFDQTIEPIFRGRAGAFGEVEQHRLLARRPLGATDLAAALAYAAKRGAKRLVLFTDAVSTTGEGGDALETLAKDAAWERIDVVVDGRAIDAGAATRLAALGTSPGVVVGAALAPGELAKRLGSEPRPPIHVAVDDATWSWPETLDGVAPGESALVFATVAASDLRDRDRLAITLSGGVEQEIEVPLVGAPRALVERAWSGARIAWLRRTAPANAHEQIVALALQQRLVTEDTSMLLLEDPGAYARAGIDATALTDIISFDDQGQLTVLRRSSHASDVPADQAPAPDPSLGATATTGAIAGVVVDGAGARLGDVTVVATSPALQGSSSEVTDEDGYYLLSHLPPGTYEVVFYYSDIKLRVAGITVRPGEWTSLDRTLETSAAKGQDVAVREKSHTIDQSGTKQQTDIKKDYVKNAPYRGRTYDSVLGAAAGSQGDAMGVSFSGSDSVENDYVIDGINTTGAEFYRSAPKPRDTSPHFDDRYARVARMLRDGERDKALVFALRWSAARPADHLALLALGDALEDRGAFALAARAYGSLVDLEPTNAETRRIAASRLERLGPAGVSLALDSYQRAIVLRPDQASGMHLYALALARAGRLDDAFTTLEHALASGALDTRAPRVLDVIAGDLDLVAAALVHAHPERREEIERRAAAVGGAIATWPSLRISLTWEQDMSDLDLHVLDGKKSHARPDHPALASGGEILGNVTAGYGPEELLVDDTPTAFPYDIGVNYAQRGTAGLGVGVVTIVQHDGHGSLAFDSRPFVVLDTGAWVGVGKLSRPLLP